MTTIVVGNWRLDEGEGEFVGDSTGNRNNGQFSSLDHPLTWTDGRKLGLSALHFDGINTNAVKTGSNPTSTVLEPSTITVEARVRSNDPNPINKPEDTRLNAYIVA